MSQPADTITGIVGLGENRTHETLFHHQLLDVLGEDEIDLPLGVSVVGDVEFTFTEGVPEFDGSVSGGRDDLTVVGGERDAEILAFGTRKV